MTRSCEEKKTYRAGLYMRLSKDDEGSGESSSITNQRCLLTAYATERGYAIASEYIDDGYSGTNFERPAFQRMLRDIEARKINLILVKDLSRLGREYIQTGQYTEVYFPAKKVRFIAVNDGFDSESPYTDMAPFQHVVNEMYARDTSKKIRSAFLGKMKEGKYIGNFAPYGYRKDPQDKNHLLPDEKSAAVVRRIFSMAANGKKPTEIATVLNGEGVLSPLLYRCACHAQLDPKRYGGKGEWTAGTMRKLLSNVVYLGHMAQGKTTKPSFKTPITLSNPQKDWIVVKDTHEALVSEAVFFLSAKRMAKRSHEKTGAFCNLFSGLARCADCGRGMSAVGTRRKNSPANLTCGGYKSKGTAACSNHFVDYAVFYQMILSVLREKLRLSPKERESLMHDLYLELTAEKDESEQQLLRLQAEEEKVGHIIEQIYEDSLEGSLSAQRRRLLLQKYEIQIQRLEAKRDALQVEKSTTERERALSRLSQCLERLENLETLNADLLFSLIDHIDVEQGQSGERGKQQAIRVYFRFQDKEACYHF